MDGRGLDSIYFSEFSIRVKAADIYELFGCNGDIVDVSIAPFRNKIGKIFGFAIFNKGEYLRMLAVRLDNIIIDGKKIRANPHRFSRKREVDGGRVKGAGGIGEGDAWMAFQRMKPEAQYGRRVRGGFSFTDAVGNRKQGDYIYGLPALKFNSSED